MGKLIETVQPNRVNAPVLFVGTGGIGSKIVKGVADRALHDDNSNLRFVIMDTDVNDISKSNKGANIIAVQTSSTATIETYLKNDKIAKDYWFPENKMLDSKPVSEGAGQVRAISRLALNACIKEGKIVKLYKAIDDLFLKDGGEFKQAIKVVIASTAAGGTGSGIAMEVGMLIRHYINKNYPEAAVMIRGFLVMPGVLDTVIDTQSERDSIRCNGYATIKEINAFMMKGSGFFDTVPELRRYKDLSVSIPNATSGEEKLSNLPFDFCFLMDRTDSNSGNMITLSQYIDFASQAIYEQTIGPMNTSASSKEDNVLKLCISPDTLGRCRFAGMGASKLVYPYDKIRRYIALNWARASIIGTSSDSHLTEEQRKELLKNSWLQYDIQYRQEKKEHDDNPASGKEPTIEEVYVNAMIQGKEDSAGNSFTANLWRKGITPKYLQTKKAKGDVATESSPDLPTMLDDIVKVDSDAEKICRSYVSKIIEEAFSSRLTMFMSSFTRDMRKAETQSSEALTHSAKYGAIAKLDKFAKSDDVVTAATNLAKGIFYSKAPVSKADLGEYMLEKFVQANGNVLHPNSVRFLLYSLKAFLAKAEKNFSSGANEKLYKESVTSLTMASDKASRAKFNVPGLKAMGKEENLSEMCQACDDAKKFMSDPAGLRCENMLNDYFSKVNDFLICRVGLAVCRVARPAVDALIKAFQDFFNSFDSKVPDIEKKKEDIVTSLQFKNGDYIYNLLNRKEYLDHLTAIVQRPAESGDATAALYAKVFESVRNNSYIDTRNGYNPFDYEMTEDVFDDVIIKYYEDMVGDNVDAINVPNILSAIKLEFDIKNSLEISETSPVLKARKQRELITPENLSKYIRSTIQRCRNLASPGIKKNNQDEERAVDAVAHSASLTDGGGIRVSEFLPSATVSDTISAYELHFFRSVYNITPIQLTKLCAPAGDDIENQFSLSTEGELDLKSVGDYFRIYQKYMDKIGPDSRKSAIITPHVDQRWNAISVLPELDMDYQKILMSKIHKAMLYGFVYDRIIMRPISDEDPDEKVYVYLDDEEYKNELIVSNGTKCDLLYEVLDAFYFDRKAVSCLRDYVNSVRVKIQEKGAKKVEESEFFRCLSKLNRKKVLNIKGAKAEETISLFEIVLLYCNSLPAQDKDDSEMRTMIDSIVDIIHEEVALFTHNPDTILSRTADELIKQFALFAESYLNNRELLRIGIFSDDVIETAKGTLIRFLKANDLGKYVDKVRDIKISE